MRFSLVALAAFVLGTAEAQPRLVADLAGSEGSAPAFLTVYDGRLFFAATANGDGRELWAYDASTDALVLAADIDTPDSGGSYQGSFPSHLAAYGGELFFRIDEDEHHALWAYDGRSGTAREVSPTPPGLWYAPSGHQAGPAWFTEYDGRLFYIGWSSERGKGLWAYDASTGEAGPVLDVPGEFDPASLIVLGGKLLFTAEAGYRTRGLFAYDAATGEAVSVAPSVRNPGRAVVYDGRLYTVADLGQGHALWEYDPGTGEARSLTAANPGSPVVFYSGRVWVYGPGTLRDVLAGVEPETGVVTKVQGPYLSGFLPSVDPVVYDGRLWLSSNDNVHGQELWVYDAATGQLAMAADINARVGGMEGFSSAPEDLTVYDGRLFFSADDGIRGREVWAYDAATETASLLADVEASEGSSPQSVVSVGGRLLFTACGGVERPAGCGLWETDGAATVPIDPFWVDGNGTRPEILGDIDGTLYLAHDDGPAYLGGHGRELWAYDTASGEARLLYDLRPAEGDENRSSNPTHGAVLGGRLYFNADDGVHGRELWAYDPATDVAALAADVQTGEGNGDPWALTVHAGGLYFVADDGVAGHELWSYDPASGAASLALDLMPGPVPSFIDGLTSYDGRLYFVGRDSTTEQLRAYDPATDTVSPVPLAEGVEVDRSYSREPLLVFDGRFVFPARTRSPEWEGTTLAAFDAATGQTTALSRGERPAALAAVGRRLYFTARTYEFGQELWVYDPVADSSWMGVDLVPGRDDSYPHGFTVHEGALYFAASTPRSGDELWVYDGLGPVSTERPPVPGGLHLSAPSPNPARAQVRLWLTTDVAAPVRVTVHDMLGREVLRLHDGPLAAGVEREVLFETAALPAGVYLVRAVGLQGQATQPITVVR